MAYVDRANYPWCDDSVQRPGWYIISIALSSSFSVSDHDDVNDERWS